MARPERVAECVDKIQSVTKLPVTVKTRIGIDDQDSHDFLTRFIQTVHAAGCDTFIIHARKAILHGLSPKQNRQAPPLCYQRVYRLKRDFPDLHIIINGGIADIDGVKAHLREVDGVMLGAGCLPGALPPGQTRPGYFPAGRRHRQPGANTRAISRLRRTTTKTRRKTRPPDTARHRTLPRPARRKILPAKTLGGAMGQQHPRPGRIADPALIQRHSCSAENSNYTYDKYDRSYRP